MRAGPPGNDACCQGKLLPAPPPHPGASRNHSPSGRSSMRSRSRGTSCSHRATARSRTPSGTASPRDSRMVTCGAGRQDVGVCEGRLGVAGPARHVPRAHRPRSCPADPSVGPVQAGGCPNRTPWLVTSMVTRSPSGSARAGRLAGRSSASTSAGAGAHTNAARPSTSSRRAAPWQRVYPAARTADPTSRSACWTERAAAALPAPAGATTVRVSSETGTAFHPGAPAGVLGHEDAVQADHGRHHPPSPDRWGLGVHARLPYSIFVLQQDVFRTERVRVENSWRVQRATRAAAGGRRANSLCERGLTPIASSLCRQRHTARLSGSHPCPHGVQASAIDMLFS